MEAVPSRNAASASASSTVSFTSSLGSTMGSIDLEALQKPRDAGRGIVSAIAAALHSTHLYTEPQSTATRTSAPSKGRANEFGLWNEVRKRICLLAH